MAHKIEVDSGNPYRDELGRFDSKDGVDGSKPYDGELDLDDLFSEEELDDEIMSLDLEDVGSVVEFDDEIASIPMLTEEQEALVDELGYGDVELSLINEFTDLDAEKIKAEASEEKLRVLLKARILLDKKEDLLVNDKKLSELNKEQFFNLWREPKSAADYQELIETESVDGSSNKFEAKLNYFQNFYKGEDKEQKLDELSRLKELGEQYTERKNEIENTYKDLESFVAPFKNGATSPYSEYRKKKATFITTSGSDAMKTYGEKAEEVLNDLRENDPKAFESIHFYTGSFSVINEPLRGVSYGKTDPSPFGFKDTVEAMTRAIDKSTYDFDFKTERSVSSLSLSSGITISEYMSEKDLASLVGQEFKQQGFYSSSTLQSASLPDKGIILNTYCPKGTKGIFVESISKHPGQYEMIIQRGYSFRITGAKKDHGKIRLDVEVILGSDSEKYTSKQLDEIRRRYVS